MKQVAFDQVGIGGTFLIRSGPDVFEPEEDDVWCSKIDESRYIVIGESGSHSPPRWFLVHVEA